MISFLRTFDYDICLAKANSWTVDEAVDYLAAYLAGKQEWQSRDDAFKGLINIREQLVGAVLHNIEIGRLIVDEAFEETGSTECGGDLSLKRSTVKPSVFIHWAQEMHIEVPPAFADFVARKMRDKSWDVEALGVKRSTIHHERARAIAALLWQQQPELTITEMALRSEIHEFGCEGQHYDNRTICRWLASLKDDRHPGRPKSRQED